MIKKICVLFLFIASAPLYLASTANGNESLSAVRFSSVSVEGYDGPARGQFGVTPLVTVTNLTLDNEKLPKKYITFEFEGDVRSNELNQIGFTSKLGMTSKIKDSVASQKNHSQLGNRFYFYTNQVSKTKAFMESLSETDRRIVKAICTIFADDKLSSKIIDAVRRDSKGKSSEYKDFFSSTNENKRLKEMKGLGSACLKSLRSVDNSTNYSQSVSLGTTSVCGYKFDESQSRSDMIAVQKGLAKRKLYTGGIDGIFGSGSCKAFNKWAECESVGQKTISSGSLAN